MKSLQMSLEKNVLKDRPKILEKNVKTKNGQCNRKKTNKLLQNSLEKM